MNFKNKKVIQPISNDLTPSEVHVPDVTLANEIVPSHTEGALYTPPPPSQSKPFVSREPKLAPVLPTISLLPESGQWTQSILVRLLIPLLLAAALSSVAFILTNGQSYQLDAITLTALLIGLSVTFVIASFYIWGLERVFLKASEKSWKAWVPIYSLGTLYKISGFSPHWAWLEFIPEPHQVASLLDSPITRLMGPAKILLLPLYIISVIAFIVKLVIKIRAFTELAKRFGKTALFGILILLGPGILILGFGKATYSDDPEVDHAKLFTPTKEPTVYQLVWRAFLLFLLIPPLYSIITSVTASLLGAGGFIAMLFFAAIIIPLSTIIIPAYIIHYVMKSVIESYGQKFIVINTGAISKYCFAFVTAYGVLFYAVFMDVGNTIILQLSSASPTDTLISLAPLAALLVAFPILGTCYFLIAYALTQDLRTKTVTRVVTLGLGIAVILAAAITLIVANAQVL